MGNHGLWLPQSGCGNRDDVLNAIECIRRSLHYSPRQEFDFSHSLCDSIFVSLPVFFTAFTLPSYSPPLLSPNAFRYASDVAYLNLANVLHRSHKSSDAIVPLKLALEISPDTNILHYTLGNIYVVSPTFIT